MKTMLAVIATILSVIITQTVSGGAIATNGLREDLNADVGVVSDANGVSVWSNQVAGAGDDVSQPNNALKPVMQSGVVNGHNALRFGSGTTYRQLFGDDAAAFDDIVQGSGCTWFAVVQSGSQNYPLGSIFGTLGNDAPWSGISALVSPNGAAGKVANSVRTVADGDVLASGTNVVVDGSFHVLAGRMTSGSSPSITVYHNGPVAQGSNTVSALAEDAGPLSVGSRRSGLADSQFFCGDIARILIYNRNLSDLEFDQTGSALGETYGITTSFTPPTPPATSNLLFLAHFDGNTANGGLDADYAKGSRVPSSTTGVSLATGRFGTGAYMPGNTVALPFPAAGNISAARGTVDFWYKPDHDSEFLNGHYPGLFDAVTTSGDRFINLYFVYAASNSVFVTLYAEAIGVSGSYSVSVPAPFPAGTNIHFAATWNCTNGVQVFVNGQAGAFLNKTWTTNLSSFYVGGSSRGFLDACGVIDEVRITGNVEYSGNFTPWQEPYPLPPPAGTIVLFH